MSFFRKKRSTRQSAPAAASSSSTSLQSLEAIKQGVFNSLQALLTTEEEVKEYQDELTAYIQALKNASNYASFIKTLNVSLPKFIDSKIFMKIQVKFVRACETISTDLSYRSFFAPHLKIKDSLSPNEVLAILRERIQESEETNSDVNPFANAFKALALANTSQPLQHISCTFDSAIPNTDPLALSQVYSYLLAYDFMEQIVTQFPKHTEFFLVGSALPPHSAFSLANSNELILPIEGAFLVLPEQNPLYIHLLGIGNAQFVNGSESLSIGAAGSQSVDSPKIYELEPTGILKFGNVQLSLERLGFNQEPRQAVDPTIYDQLFSCFKTAINNTAQKVWVFEKHHPALHEQAMISLNDSVLLTATQINSLKPIEGVVASSSASGPTG